MIVLLISIVFILVVIIIPYYKCKIRHFRQRNKVHFYVARDKDGSLFLHIGKPIRSETEFYSKLYYNNVEFYCPDYSFGVFGLNKNDYANLKWEDEPIEVFVNMEN